MYSRDWKEAATRWRTVAANALIPARVEKGKLYFGTEIMKKGDNVRVYSELTRQEFSGVMFLFAPNEVVVRLTDGTKARIPLQHLRHGRVSLALVGGPVAAEWGSDIEQLQNESTINVPTISTSSANVNTVTEKGPSTNSTTTSNATGRNKRSGRPNPASNKESKHVPSSSSQSVKSSKAAAASATSNVSVTTSEEVVNASSSTMESSIDTNVDTVASIDTNIPKETDAKIEEEKISTTVEETNNATSTILSTTTSQPDTEADKNSTLADTS